MTEQTFTRHNIRVHKDLVSSQDTSIRLFPIAQKPGEEKINSITIFNDAQIAIGVYDHEIEFPEVQADLKSSEGGAKWIGVYSDRHKIYIEGLTRGNRLGISARMKNV